MKKTLKITFIVAGIIILTGIICVLIAFCSSGFSFNKMFLQDYEIKTVVIKKSSGITNIEFDNQYFDVEIYESEDGVLRIEYPEVENVIYDYKIDSDGRTLRNSISDNRKWYEHVNWRLGYSDNKTKIYLPKQEYKSFKLKCDSSDVSFRCNIDIGSCEIVTKSGDIHFSNSSADNINLSTSSGDIRFTFVEKIEANLQTVSGDIYIGNVSEAKVLARTTSGDITAETNRFKRFNARTESGDISSKIMSATDWIGLNTTSGDINIFNMRCHQIYLESVSGDIEFDKLDNQSINIETTSGDVEGYLLNPTRFLVETTSGDKRIGGYKEDSGRLCFVKTVSGDVSVEVKE